MRVSGRTLAFSAILVAATVVAFGPGRSAAAPARGLLRLSESNPRYFATPGGTPLLLAGAHDGWELQDYAWGDRNAGVLFEWDTFLDFLVEHNHNVIRLWCVEHTKISDDDPDLTSPMPFVRVSGRGKANDGAGKFDLDRFDPAYFNRLRARTIQARDRGVYVIVMLFQGWSIDDKGGKVNPWPYHPFHPANNINGVNGDEDGDGQGEDLHTWLGDDHPITRRQRRYVRKVIDKVNDLDNVLFEIANESHTESIEWQTRMVDFIHKYEKTKPRQHPVGMTACYGGARKQGSNQDLFQSPADWISPNRQAGRTYNFRDNPPPAGGRKVVLSDTDHLFGTNCKDYRWVWKTFCRGHNLLYMDMWTVERDDPDRGRVRRALGHVRGFARRMDLAATVPRPELASSGYCLSNAGREYLVYNPQSGDLTLDLTNASGTYAVEWFNPRTGERTKGGTARGGVRRTFKPPFAGDSVLFLESDN